jgi:hypothetical protein
LRRGAGWRNARLETDVDKPELIRVVDESAAAEKRTTTNELPLHEHWLHESALANESLANDDGLHELALNDNGLSELLNVADLLLHDDLLSAAAKRLRRAMSMSH